MQNAQRGGQLSLATAPERSITNTSLTVGRFASGPVEGACKNLIKDRMERSGLRWTEPMAEAMVQLPAIHISGDSDRYWQFHIDQDQRRLYPAWAVVPK
jgi:hypothetical protein